MSPVSPTSSTTEYAAVILTGGTGSRLGGVDKALLQHRGRRLIDHALAAVRHAHPVVVVGPAVPVATPVLFTREEPPGSGPAAGVLAGRDAVSAAGGDPPPGLLVVLAVDMPGITPDTVTRLVGSVGRRDGAVLVDRTGRRQLAAVLRLGRLGEAWPGGAPVEGLSIRRLLAPLDLVDVPARDAEAADIDTRADLAT